MPKLALIYGYLGALPFIALAVIPLLTVDVDWQLSAHILHLIYGAMILSFLGGVHWTRGVPDNNITQITLSMGPTIISLGLLIMAYLYNMLIPMIVMALLFWALYAADRKYIAAKSMPAGYFRMRLILTIIVSSTLMISGLLML